jgi:hypothetical protein
MNLALSYCHGQAGSVSQVHRFAIFDKQHR